MEGERDRWRDGEQKKKNEGQWKMMRVRSDVSPSFMYFSEVCYAAAAGVLEGH